MTGKQPFEAVVSAHGATVLRVCRAVLGPADAEDAWSETFLSAMKAYPALPADANVEAWLVTIAHRKAIDVTRAAARRAIPVAEAPDTPAEPTDGHHPDLDGDFAGARCQSSCPVTGSCAPTAAWAATLADPPPSALYSRWRKQHAPHRLHTDRPHRGTRIYGRLNCSTAQRALTRGGYAEHRVFFADEATAIAAGYRPCATCLLDSYQAWKAGERP